MIDVTIDPSSAIPPFEQLRTRISGLVAEGTLAPGTKLPTVRQLAGDLGLAANTVARAYRELESDRVLATYGRRGTFVSSQTLDPAAASLVRIAAVAADYASVARRAGLSAPEALRLVERAWAAGGGRPGAGPAG